MANVWQLRPLLTVCQQSTNFGTKSCNMFTKVCNFIQTATTGWYVGERCPRLVHVLVKLDTHWHSSTTFDNVLQVLPQLGKLWPTWANICKLWPTVVNVGKLWQPLANFGKPWQTVAIFGILWLTLANFGHMWQALANFGQLWPTLVKFGKRW